MIKKLQEALDREIPKKTLDDSILIASFNIREYGGRKYGNRNNFAIECLSSIIRKYDIVAVQEIKKDLKALDKLMEFLGSNWAYLITDVTEGRKGNGERMAYIYDKRKIKFGGLAGEVFLEDTSQLARTPFIVGFESNGIRFMLCTVHIYYGESKAEPEARVKEIRELAKHLSEKIDKKDEWCDNLILLGDFNIFATDDITFKSITDAGFYIPEQIQKLPSNVNQDKHYDQIAFKFNSGITVQNAGTFNFFDYIYRDKDEKLFIINMGKKYLDSEDKSRYYKQWRTFQISDHLPMYIEIRFNK